jgi:tetratricopeptide (TPR) repeat protein
MNRIRLFLCAAPLILVACASVSNKGTIAELRQGHIEIKEEKIEDGLEKAMLSYQRFLDKTPDSALTAEAIRRLADLKIEKEYGTLTTGAGTAEGAKALPAPKPATRPEVTPVAGAPPEQALAHIPVHEESEADFEKRATMRQPVDSMAAAADTPVAGAGDLERAGAREAIALYEKLLNDYPLYERNDQVLYQMSRAYEELGQTEEAMAVMDRMVREYRRSRYFDEVQFRRAEYFFARKRYLDAENAYASIVDMGVGFQFYELALYKLGWTFYKQELYENALQRFIALMDHKVSVGYDFEQTEDEQERKRTDDTFRVISLSFSNLGGADSAVILLRQAPLRRRRRGLQRLRGPQPVPRGGAELPHAGHRDSSRWRVPQSGPRVQKEIRSGLRSAGRLLETFRFGRAAGRPGSSEDQPDRPGEPLSCLLPGPAAGRRQSGELRRGAALVPGVSDLVPRGRRIARHQLPAGGPAAGKPVVRRSGRGIREDRVRLSGP